MTIHTTYTLVFGMWLEKTTLILKIGTRTCIIDEKRKDRVKTIILCILYVVATHKQE